MPTSSMVVCAVAVLISEIPPTKPSSEPPSRNRSQAITKAAKDEEQAVFTVTLGPRKLKKYEMRAAIADTLRPVREWGLISRLPVSLR